MHAVLAVKDKLDFEAYKGAIVYCVLAAGLIANGVWIGWLTWKAASALWFVIQLLR